MHIYERAWGVGKVQALAKLSHEGQKFYVNITILRFQLIW